jgi:metal-responsive CopG/Arc/MetJ family transcriptional regulator
MSKRSRNNPKEKTVLVAVKLPVSLLEAMDARIARDPESNRSQFARRALRERLARETTATV